MRVTKRIEEYVRDEVRKISACKEAAIRERYQPEFDALEAFKEAIVKCKGAGRYYPGENAY